MNTSVTVVGGGVIGLCCAYYLRKQGHSVILVDDGQITQGTSFGNAGYISPSHFVPLSSPGIIAKGLRWMLSSTSPFYIKPRLDADLLRWCLSFWRNANEETVRRNAVPLTEILHLSRTLTINIRQELGNTFRMQEIGCFNLYRQAATEAHEIQLARTAEKLGIETIVMNGQQVQDCEPQVQVNVRGGVLYPIDCHLHPGEFMHSLHDACRNMGVEFRLGVSVSSIELSGRRVTSLETTEGRLPVSQLVLAGGSWLSRLASMLDIRLLLQAGKGYSMTFAKPARNLTYPAILVDHRVAMTPMGEDLRMGGTMEISGINHRILMPRVKAIFQAARLYYPDLPVEFPTADRIWHGLRPLSPDGLPYIGRHRKYDNVHFAGGHAMLGLSLAAATGLLIAESVSERKPSMNTDAFSPNRFRS